MLDFEEKKEDQFLSVEQFSGTSGNVSDAAGKNENPVGDPPADTVKKIRRKKIRVELIKENGASASASAEEEKPKRHTVKSAPARAGSDNQLGEEPSYSYDQSDEDISAAIFNRLTMKNKGQNGDSNGEKEDEKNILSINDLTRMSLPDLREFAIQIGAFHDNIGSLRKQEIIFNILKAHTAKNGIIHA